MSCRSETVLGEPPGPRDCGHSTASQNHRRAMPVQLLPGLPYRLHYSRQDLAGLPLDEVV